MKTEQCLISTLEDVKELNKIMKNQIKMFGPFTITFEFREAENE